jgi:hypothetical protein
MPTYGGTPLRVGRASARRRRRRHACRPTGGTPLRVARVSTRRRRRRHACRPTGGTPLRVARVSTRRRRRRHECRPTAGRHSAWLGFQPDDLAVGMNADLRTGHRPGSCGSGFNPTCPSARMPTYGHDPGPGPCGSGFNPTRPRRHECRPTGTTSVPALAHVGRVSTRLPVGTNADLRARPRLRPMWVGFQPDCPSA